MRPHSRRSRRGGGEARHSMFSDGRRLKVIGCDVMEGLMRMHFLVAAVLCWLGVMASGTAAQGPLSSGQQASASRAADLGAQLVTVTPAMPHDRRQGVSFGALVEHVAAGGAADQAGVKIGDVILSIDDK